MRMLLTGFDPFGELETNPSQAIVQVIEERWKSRSGIVLTTEVLRTEYAAAEDRIRDLLREIRPDAILCLGASQNLSSISLERVAVNLDDECAADNAGEVRRAQPIVSDGAPAYWSTLPLELMREALERRGVPVAFSNDAGSFVCNHVFYVALNELQVLDFEAQCGLIHVPLTTEQAITSKRSEIGLPLEVMVTGIEGCLEVILEKRGKSAKVGLLEQAQKS